MDPLVMLLPFLAVEHSLEVLWTCGWFVFHLLPNFCGICQQRLHVFFDLLLPVCHSLYRSELGPIAVEIELALHTKLSRA